MFLLRMTAAAAFALLATTLVRADESAGAAKPMSLKECGEQYRAAKADGSLGERNWLDFRRSACGIAAKPAQAAARSEAATAELLRRVSFPAALDPAFADQKPAQQRMRTCLKSYHANKQSGSLAGLRWVQKGGGYYSLCAAKLKAQSA